MDKEESFYKSCFEDLKKELDFSLGAIFYKNGGRYFLKYKIPFSRKFENFMPHMSSVNAGVFTFKIPLVQKDTIIGYFLIVREKKFTNDERKILKQSGELFSEKIKDFELSKIFKNQLFILQEAILKKSDDTKRLAAQNEKLIELDKMRMKFLANVSHELRTPLNSIIGFSTALLSDMKGKLNPKQKDYANKILSSAIHLTGLINDILDMTKIESGAMQLNLRCFEPDIIINEVINTIEPLAIEKNIKIEPKLSFGKTVLLDERKFRQIIYNLAGNAIKFSYPDSKIIISTLKRKNKLYVKVKDFGIGIEKKYQKIIFDKFIQLDNPCTKQVSSTGLGLTITKELLKMQNAEIKVKSELKKGSEFTAVFKIEESN